MLEPHYEARRWGYRGPGMLFQKWCRVTAQGEWHYWWLTLHQNLQILCSTSSETFIQRWRSSIPATTCSLSQEQGCEEVGSRKTILRFSHGPAMALTWTKSSREGLHRVEDQKIRFRNAADLQERLEQEWKVIPAKYWKKLFDSMPKHKNALI